MTHLLDTNACIRCLRDASSSVGRRYAASGPDEVVVCSIVISELHYGVHRSARPEENLALLNAFLAPLVSFPFDDRAAEIAGRIRAELDSAGTPIGPLDLQIAAIALVNGLTLVTHNIREFSRVAGLRMEDWEADAP